MTGRPELRALTGARGIAAWWVVLFHLRSSVPGLSPAARAVLARGYLAVDFFFLLSGFVIWLSWHERLASGSPVAVLAFWQKRVARIWPLHLLVMACAVALAVLLAAIGHPDPVAFPPRELPLHLLLLQDWGFTRALSWNDPAWSISAELGAYCLFPTLALMADWRRWPDAALLAVAAGLLILLHLGMGGASTLGRDITRLGLLRCLAEFATGTIVAALWVRWHTSRRAPWCCALLAGALLTGRWVGLPETLVVPAALAALLLVLALTAGRRGNPLEGRVLHYLGDISYATYLGHYLLWTVFKLVMVRDPNAVPAGVIALYLATVLVSSAALYRWWERPAQRWVNRLAWPSRQAVLRPTQGRREIAD